MLFLSLRLCFLCDRELSQRARRRSTSQKGNEKKLSELESSRSACAIEVHRTLGGPGLLESVYEEALVWELEQRGLKVKRQVDFPIPYKGRKLSKHFRIDVLVQDFVLVDTQAVTDFHDIFETQMLTYLRLTGLKLGMVINFGEKLVKDGIHRVVNGL